MECIWRIETFGCPVGPGPVSEGGGWRQVGRAVADGLTFGELERRVALVRVGVAAAVEEAEVAATEHAALSDGSAMAWGADALATAAVRESTMRRLAEGGAAVVAAVSAELAGCVERFEAVAVRFGERGLKVADGQQPLEFFRLLTAFASEILASQGTTYCAKLK